MNTISSLFSHPDASFDFNQLSLNRTAPQSGGKFKKFAMGLTVTAALGAGVIMTDIDTARTLDQSFLTIKLPRTSWISQEVKNWLTQDYGLIALSGMSDLHAVIQNVFGAVKISTNIYNDPDESWSKVQLQIHSLLGDDFEQQLALEENLFSAICASPSLHALTQRLIISQV